MKNFLQNSLKFISLAFLFLMFDVIYIIVFYLLNIDINSISSNTEMLLIIIKNVIILLILLITYRKYLIAKFHDFKNNFSLYLDKGIKYWLIGLLIMFISNSIINSLTSSIAENENNVQSLITSYPVIAFFLTTICAPFTEELIFRKSLNDAIKNKTAFIIISGLIFGYLHVVGSTSLLEYLYIIPYGSLGASFAYLLVKTDNIYTSIMMHMIHNGLLTILAVIF